jgi:glycine/serine hydroxymethyltransferase
MGENEMTEIATFITAALRGRHDERAVAGVKSTVYELCGRFPPYPTLTGDGAAAGPGS